MVFSKSNIALLALALGATNISNSFAIPGDTDGSIADPRVTTTRSINSDDFLNESDVTPPNPTEQDSISDRASLRQQGLAAAINSLETDDHHGYGNSASDRSLGSKRSRAEFESRSSGDYSKVEVDSDSDSQSSTDASAANHASHSASEPSKRSKTRKSIFLNDEQRQRFAELYSILSGPQLFVALRSEVLTPSQSSLFETNEAFSQWVLNTRRSISKKGYDLQAKQPPSISLNTEQLDQISRQYSNVDIKIDENFRGFVWQLLDDDQKARFPDGQDSWKFKKHLYHIKMRIRDSLATALREHDASAANHASHSASEPSKRPRTRELIFLTDDKKRRFVELYSILRGPQLYAALSSEVLTSEQSRLFETNEAFSMWVHNTRRNLSYQGYVLHTKQPPSISLNTEQLDLISRQCPNINFTINSNFKEFVWQLLNDTQKICFPAGQDSQKFKDYLRNIKVKISQGSNN